MQDCVYPKEKKKQIGALFAIQFIVITAGFSSLLKISSEYLDNMVYTEDFSNYYVSYLLCYGLGIASLIYNYMRNNCGIKDRYTKTIIYVFSLLFAFIMTCANYALWLLPSPEYAGHMFRNIYRLIYMASIFAGTGCASYNFFCCLTTPFYLWKSDPTDRKRPAAVFVVVLVTVFLVDFVILMLCKYPGNLVTDSFAQIYQATGDFEYGNHHPFYHTLVIKLLLDMGMSVFGGYNAAVAVYSTFQILFMAACFAYGIMFLYELSVPRWILIVATGFYALAPYHIMYSFTMTKDVMFGGFILISAIALFRSFTNMGKPAANLTVTVISGIGICLFRSNGFFVYILWTAVVLFVFRRMFGTGPGKVIKKTLLCMAGVLVVSFILKHPVLTALDVSQTDFVEALSVPLQQIGRTVVEHDDLSEEENELLSQVLSVDKIRESYYRTTSDPLKERIREEGNGKYITSHKLDYLMLYLKIGLKHPGSYFTGWIDETCGFWNGGYRDWHWYDWVRAKIYDNRYDIRRTVRNDKLNDLVNEYLWLFEEIPFLQLSLCLGLHMWIDFVMLYIALLRRDKEGAAITLPIIFILFSLMIAAPDSTTFRYVYSTFCLLPVMVPAVLRPDIREKVEQTDK